MSSCFSAGERATTADSISASVVIKKTVCRRPSSSKPCGRSFKYDGAGAYRVPMQVNRNRQQSLAIRWHLQAVHEKKGRGTYEKLAEEIIATYKRERGEYARHTSAIHGAVRGATRIPIARAPGFLTADSERQPYGRPTRGTASRPDAHLPMKRVLATWATTR
ncbi:MAG: hypothetical protein WD060_04770 [Pirellulales bacterium]